MGVNPEKMAEDGARTALVAANGLDKSVTITSSTNPVLGDAEEALLETKLTNGVNGVIDTGSGNGLNGVNGVKGVGSANGINGVKTAQGLKDKKDPIDIKDPKDPKKLKKGSALRQVLAALIANLGTINTGMMFGFSAVTNPQLRSPDSEIPIDENAASWIASLASAATPIGCLLTGWLMDALGRRRALLITQLPLLAGWIMICTAQSLPMLYVGRMLVGLGSGMVGAPARVYVAEVTQPHLRGTLAALASVGVSFGVLFEYVVGSAVSWRWLAALSAAVPLLALALTAATPETPPWLLRAGRPEKAEASLRRLRGAACDTPAEMERLTQFAATNQVAPPSGWKATLRALAHSSVRRPFFMLIAYFAIYQFSGVNPLTFYAVDVFQQTGTALDKNVATIVMGSVRLVFTVAGCALQRRLGRRPLTLLSSIGCGLTMLGLGSYLMAFPPGGGPEGTQPPAAWFPAMCIFLYTAFCTVGFLIVPWIMIGEVYPARVRGIVGGLTTCSAHFFVFLVVKTYPLLNHLLSNGGVYLFYGTVSLLGTIFFYSCLPETKGRSLQEIEDFFSGRTATLGSSTWGASKTLKAPKGQALP